jgi:hypothetical protein
MIGAGLAILGAIVASIIGLIGNREGSPGQRRWLALFIIFAGAVSCVGAVVAFRDSEDAHRQITSLQTSLNVANRSIGDLAVLDRLGGNGVYDVQIAADTAPERLAPIARNMEGQFGGDAARFVCIAYPRPGSGQYRLLFGHDVPLASAEVFMRVASLKGFSNGAPEIHREATSPTRCWTAQVPSPAPTPAP